VAITDDFDLGRLGLSGGEARRLGLDVRTDSLAFGGERYEIDSQPIRVVLDISRLTGSGFSLRLHFQAHLSGPCMRCLAQAEPVFDVDAREVDQPGEGEELDSPYVRDEVLDLRAWAHDALALALPAQVLCRAECAGLCAVCGADLSQAGPDHQHPRAPDPRWAKLSELKLG
jgi:uncharacterized protein